MRPSGRPRPAKHPESCPTAGACPCLLLGGSTQTLSGFKQIVMGRSA